jgi:hypothetical protein
MNICMSEPEAYLKLFSPSMAVENEIQTAQSQSQLHTPDECPIPIHKTDGSKSLKPTCLDAIFSATNQLSFNIISNQPHLCVFELMQVTEVRYPSLSLV